MTVAGLAEQFEPPGDGAAVDPPSRDVDPVGHPSNSPAVDAPAEPETVARLLAANAELRQKNAAMAARLAQLEAPPERWMPLKRGAAACRPPLPYEYVRRLAAADLIKAKRERRRWFIDVASVDARQQRLFAK
jgi:hypothetical protein